jgi:putative redox protein
MPADLTVQAIHQSGMHFTAAARGHTIDIDYPLQEGDEGAGLTALEALLAALTTCCGNTMVVLLNKMRLPFDGIEVTAHAERCEEHPTVLTRIDLEVIVRGDGVDQAAAERALKIGEEQICPVWAMLRPGTPVSATVRVEEG